jgi:hypothetical protein
LPEENCAGASWSKRCLLKEKEDEMVVKRSSQRRGNDFGEGPLLPPLIMLGQDRSPTSGCAQGVRGGEAELLFNCGGDRVFNSSSQ